MGFSNSVARFQFLGLLPVDGSLYKYGLLTFTGSLAGIGFLAQSGSLRTSGFLSSFGSLPTRGFLEVNGSLGATGFGRYALLDTVATVATVVTHDQREGSVSVFWGRAEGGVASREGDSRPQEG